MPNSYEDWLVCMILSKIGQEIIGLDEIISPLDSDFSETGLKSESVVRVSRLAVVSQKYFWLYWTNFSRKINKNTNKLGKLDFE